MGARAWRSLAWALPLVIGTARLAIAAGGGDHGEEADGAHGGGIGDFLYLAFNFALIIGVVVYFARKPVQEFFRTRRATIVGEIDAAAALLSEAERRNSEWQRKLADLDAELDGIRASERERASHERERILAEAHEAAERIQRDAAAAVDQELRRARTELRLEVANLATELAGQLVERELADSDRDRLLDEFITSVERSSANEAGSQAK